MRASDIRAEGRPERPFLRCGPDGAESEAGAVLSRERYWESRAPSLGQAVVLSLLSPKGSGEGGG